MEPNTDTLKIRSSTKSNLWARIRVGFSASKILFGLGRGTASVGPDLSPGEGEDKTLFGLGLLPWSLDPLGAPPHCLKPYFQGSPWSRDSQAESPGLPGAVLIAHAPLLQHLEFPWPPPRPTTQILSLDQRKSMLDWTRNA